MLHGIRIIHGIRNHSAGFVLSVGMVVEVQLVLGAAVLVVVAVAAATGGRLQMRVRIPGPTAADAGRCVAFPCRRWRSPVQSSPARAREEFYEG